MWNWDYEEEGTNIRDGVRGTVTGGCNAAVGIEINPEYRVKNLYSGFSFFDNFCFRYGTERKMQLF